MAHLFNTVNLTTYGIEATKISGSNITIKGGFDLPARIGKIAYEWGDEDGVEPYVLADELFWGGRDIELHGFMMGTRTDIKTGLLSFGAALSAVSGTGVFSTPYGNFNVYAKSVQPTYFSMGAEVKVIFREPTPVLTGGSIPATGASVNTIDSIPFLSFGLYTAPIKEIIELPEMKEMFFTKIQAEGWRNAFRKEREFNFEATLMGTTLSNFQTKVKNLYAIFMKAGLRTIILNNEITVVGYAAEGFSITDVYMGNVGWTQDGKAMDMMLGRLKCKLTVTSIT